MLISCCIVSGYKIYGLNECNRKYCKDYTVYSFSMEAKIGDFVMCCHGSKHKEIYCCVIIIRDEKLNFKESFWKIMENEHLVIIIMFFVLSIVITQQDVIIIVMILISKRNFVVIRVVNYFNI